MPARCLMKFPFTGPILTMILPRTCCFYDPSINLIQVAMKKILVMFIRSDPLLTNSCIHAINDSKGCKDFYNTWCYSFIKSNRLSTSCNLIPPCYRSGNVSGRYCDPSQVDLMLPLEFLLQVLLEIHYCSILVISHHDASISFIPSLGSKLLWYQLLCTGPVSNPRWRWMANRDDGVTNLIPIAIRWDLGLRSVNWEMMGMRERQREIQRDKGRD